MKSLPKAIRRSRAALLTVCALLLAPTNLPVRAQTNSSSAPTSATTRAEEAVQLSPFEVNATADTGYMASSTLAGSRLNSSLLTTPSAISVFTKDLLNDIAAGDVMDASLYALNAVPMLQNNPSANFEANIFSNNAVQFRGFGGGGQARNYFPWPTNSDSYNVERLDFSRGPNSILFGTGTPGGIINVTTKRANFNKDGGSVAVRVGSWDSYRSTLDYNLVLKKDVLALRLNNVWEDSKGYVDHAFVRRNGYHGAVTYQPFKSTTIRLDGEKLNQESNIARRFPLLDFYSGWTGATVATAGGAIPAGAGIVRLATTPVMIYDAHIGTIANWANQTRVSTDRGSTLEPMIGRTQNFEGPDDRNDTRTDNYSVFIEQRLFNKLFLEAAYNRTNFELAANRPFMSVASVNDTYSVNLDPNAQLPGGAPNPNVGLPYVDGNWNKQNQGNDTEDFRLTASYELNLGRWLGRHEIAGLFGRRDEGYHQAVSREIDVNRVYAPTAAIAATTIQVVRRHYLKNGDGAKETALNNIDGINGVNSEFVVWAGNQLIEQMTRQDYKQASMVSHFWKDRLTIVTGLRNDEFKVKTKDGRAQDTAMSSFYVTGDYGPWGAPFGKNTVSYGAVLELGKGAYAYANYSENFNNQGSKVPIIGSNGKFTLDTIPPRSGIGKDFGLRYSGLGGRLHASLGYYETSEKNRTFFWIGNVNTQSKIIIDKLEPGQWIANFQDVSDTDGKGYELEVTANPTPHWRLTLNAAQKSTELSNQGAFYKRLWAQKKDAWRATGDTTVINAMNIIEPLLSSFTKDGQHQQGERKYTANLYTNYEFAREGKLAGFSVGGGARYLGPAMIGYDDADANGVLETFYGGANTMVDGNLTYRRKLAHNRSLQVQLNVRNLLQEYMVQKVGIVAKAFDQAGGTIIYNTPRQLLLTSTINF